MNKFWFPLALVALVSLPEGYAVAQPIAVVNLQPILAGMATPVVLKVDGSAAKCSYMGHVVEVASGTPDARWLIKAEQRTCLKSKAGDLTISSVQALVPLDTLPVKRNSSLRLYLRD